MNGHMKNLFILLSFSFLFCAACQSGSNKNNQMETVFDEEKKTNQFLPTDDKNLFLFTQVPGNMTGCVGVFSRTEEELDAEEFVFTTDLESSCILALNERFIQIDLTSKKVMNTDRDLYRFEGDGYMVNLELREVEQIDRYTVKYRGQLRITDHAQFQKVIYIIGMTEC